MTSGTLSATLLTPHKLARTLVGIQSSLYLSPETSDPSGVVQRGRTGHSIGLRRTPMLSAISGSSNATLTTIECCTARHGDLVGTW